MKGKVKGTNFTLYIFYYNFKKNGKYQIFFLITRAYTFLPGTRFL